MVEDQKSFGRTIQLFLVDGSPSGLMIATLHGWTGSLAVCSQLTFDKLLKRFELDRTGVYILYGPDPDNPLKMKAYVGEADSVKDRIATSAANHDFWETAVAITTSDDALTKGHIRYLEARVIELANSAGRVTLVNAQQPASDKRRLPEADKANMEAFLANLKTILPVVGLDLLKPQPRPGPREEQREEASAPFPIRSEAAQKFEIRHKSGVRATAIDDGSDFVVLQGSEALKDTGFVASGYGELKRELIAQNVLKTSPNSDKYIFNASFPFRSPSAAAAVVLDRNANGRNEWKVEGERLNYHQWQQKRSGRASVETNGGAQEIG